MCDRNSYCAVPNHDKSEAADTEEENLLEHESQAVPSSSYQTERQMKTKSTQELEGTDTIKMKDPIDTSDEWENPSVGRHEHLQRPSFAAGTSNSIGVINTNTAQTSHVDTSRDYMDNADYCSSISYGSNSLESGTRTRKNIADLSPREQQKQSSPTKRNSKSLFSHLSFIFVDDVDESPDSTEPIQDNLLSGNAIRNPHQIFSFHSSLGQRAGFKRWLLVLTLAFVLGTIIHRNFHDNTKHPNHTSTYTSHTSYPTEISSRECQESSLTNQDAIMALQNTSSVSNISNGAVAADDERCSELGMTIMRDLDGNAVDAAVTTALCLGLVNPASSGIGGGGFILIHSWEPPRVEESNITNNPSSPGGIPFLDRREGSVVYESKQGVTEVIDCRETAPGDATFDMYESMPSSASSKGALSIATPGELRGLELAHSRYGRLSWKQVVEPVADLADQGVPVSKYLARIIDERKEIIDEPSFHILKVMLTKNNDGQTYLKEGELMTRPEYAATLRKVMDLGSDYIYTGDVAEVIAQEIQAQGGIVTAKDLQSYKPILRDPLMAEIDGFIIHGVPPPSSGGAAIIGILRFLSGYRNPFASFADSLSVHRMVEAFKHVFSIRMSLSDPDFFTNITTSAVRDLVSGIFIDELRKQTSDHTILPLSKYGGKWSLVNSTDDKEAGVDAHEGDRNLNVRRRTRLFGYLEDHGTSHLSVVDKDRNAVSMTTSVNFYFGSSIASSSTGILFNDVMDDFATPGKPNTYGLHPAESNYIQPGKRPLSSMSPTMIFSSQPNIPLLMVLGSSGGPKIITSVAQVIINHLYLGMDMFQSVASPRVHDQLLYHSSAGVGFEKCPLIQGALIETSERTISALRRRQQKLFSLDYTGTCQSISIDLETNRLSAVSDIRKVGMSAGY